MTQEGIDLLLQKGFKRWTKNGKDRLYINASQLGLECEYYHTGNIKNAEFRGEHISNSQAYRYKAAKTYVELGPDRLVSDYPELEDAAAELIAVTFGLINKGLLLKKEAN